MKEEIAALLAQAQGLVDNAQRLQWPACRGYWEVAGQVLADATGQLEATQGPGTSDLLGPLEFLLSARCLTGQLVAAEDTAHRLIVLTIAHETNRSDRLVRICDHMERAHASHGNPDQSKSWRARHLRMKQYGGAYFG